MSGVVKKGTTIFTGKPFVFLLYSEHRTTRCDNCLKSGKLSRCSGCQYVYYCDRNCQKESWPIHKIECACLKKAIIVVDMVRLLARVIIKLNQGGADEKSYYTEKNFRKFKDLMSNYSDIKIDMKRQRDFICLSGMLFQFLDEALMPNFVDLMGIYGRICTNYFNILDTKLNTIAVGLYLGASVIDHSCKPNVAAVFEGTTIIIRTLTDLPSLDWSKITISYIELLDSNKDRREKLHNLYYFWCNCERCKKEEPMAKAATCPNLSCESPCSIETDKCKKCSARISIKFKKTFQEVSALTASHLKGMEYLNDLSKILISKVCLMKQKNVMYKFNIQHLQTLQMAYTASTNLNCFKDAELYSKALLPGYLLYYGEVHPSTGLLYFTMAEIQLRLQKPNEALQLLDKAGTILKITHGDEHSLVKDKLNFLIYIATMMLRNTRSM
ncbi:histone-lysine N-methyltransferase SMYD3 [Monomorium pharaonis]|uniref:histone-lysine N-methyltransferase SMYD3 n=1 Tax=Monomorium pharaonis TaxID=307658 RepID=UPI00063F7314|nr:histone-lysine N-methyltransferase SMYD3 [Monomorium pharaonis]